MRGPRPARTALLLALLCGALGCTRANPAFRDPMMDDAPADARSGPTAGLDAARAPELRPDLGSVVPVDGPAPAADGPASAADAAAPAADRPTPAADAPAPAVDTPGPPADVSSPEAPPGPPPVLHFDFESGTEGWRDIRYQFFGVPQTPVTSSSAQAHRGTRALAMTISTGNESVHPTFGLPAASIQPPLKAGSRIEQWVWFPAGARLIGVQGFVYCYRQGMGAKWFGQQTPIHQLVPGAWNRLQHQVPPDLDVAAGGVIDFGVEWVGEGPLSPLTVYIDDVSVWAP